MGKRPGFARASEEMRRLSALLAAEALRWPETRMGTMFGMVSLYRGDRIFALLPDSRCAWGRDTIAVKDQTIAGAAGKKWQSVVLGENADLRGALERLEVAYRGAKLG